ncbi:hypothetical protein EDD86DRAFT_198917 [Gorgonomyces haynaldii]|nr:hypothetical protein EDD86DRAFT_198917 [Gorgonomyces haynaldii]
MGDESTHLKACDNCSKRKTKCDRVKPTCSNCTKSKQTCVYTRTRKRKNAPETVDTESTDSTEPEFSILEVAPPASPTTAKKLEESGLGDVVNSMAAFTLKKRENTHSDPAPAFTQAKPLGVVSPQLRESLSKSYAYHMQQFGFRPAIPSDWVFQEAERSPALFNTVMALGAIVHKEDVLEGRDYKELSYAFYQTACSSLPLELERNSIVLVMTLMLLLLYSQEAKMMNSVFHYRAMLLGILIDMKLYSEPPKATDQESHTNYCIRVNLFWSCYVLDRLFSTALQTDPVIPEHMISVPLAISPQEFDWQFYLQQNRNILRESSVMRSDAFYVPLLPGVTAHGANIILIKIASRASAYVLKWKNKSPSTLAELEYDEICLLSSCEQWRLKAPSFGPQVAPCAALLTWDDKVAIMALDAVIVTICRQKLISVLAQGVDKFLQHEYFQLCLDAANDCSAILKTFVDNNPMFVGVNGYVQSSIMTLGLFHIAVIQVHPDPAVVEKCKYHVDLHLKCLENLTVCMKNYKNGNQKLMYFKSMVDRLNIAPSFQPPTSTFDFTVDLSSTLLSQFPFPTAFPTDTFQDFGGLFDFSV